VVADLSAGGGEAVERTERKLQRERERGWNGGLIAMADLGVLFSFFVGETD
jgi:hypothetical protein